MAHDAQMLKGVLSLLLLSLLSEEEGYGYGIVVRLKEAGFEDLAEGTVYPALTRLEAAGLLDSRLERSTSGPARKYYRTTDRGRSELTTRAESWRALVTAVDVVTAPVVSTISTAGVPAQSGSTPRGVSR
jgi:PadR family transcriptional regulator, regulatory protein PadR